MIYPLKELELKIGEGFDHSELDEKRNALVNRHDKSLLKETDKTFNLDELNQIPQGRFSVTHSNVNFDCLFNKKKSNKLYVLLSGAKTSSSVEFKRWSYYNMFDGSMLSIADPMYKLYNDIMVGWYYGTEQQNFRELLVDIVRRVAKCINVADEDVIFFSSSGGGAAILSCAGMLEGSTAVAINPQINLDLYFYAKTFQKKLSIDFSSAPKRSDGSYWIKNSYKTKYVLIINANSKEDVCQLNHLKKQLNIKKDFFYGINKVGNLVVWLYSAEKDIPHNAQDDKTIYFSIANLIQNLDENLNSEFWKNSYMIFSEFWHHIWEIKADVELAARTAFFYDHAEPKVVALFDKITLQKSTSDYNAKVLLTEIMPQTIYKFEIENSEMNNSETTFVIGLKDNIRQRLILEKALIVGKKQEFYLSTGADTKNMEIKVYCGIPEKTKNNELSIYDLKVSVVCR